MNNTFRLRILAADKVFYEGNCTSLTIPTPGGELGILANHSNMIAAVVPGVLRGQFPDRPPQTAAVSGGVVKIEDNEVLILADTAERPEEIDANRARRTEANAREALLQKKSIQEYRSAQAYLARALNRLKVRENNRAKIWCFNYNIDHYIL